MALVEYNFTADFTVTPDKKAVFDRDGAFLVRGLLDKEEVDLILGVLENNPVLKQAWDVEDGEGYAARMLLWNQPGDDITGMVARSEKMVNTCEALLGDEVYHYHTKLMMKQAKTGGKHNWHQDYGYWYKNGCLKPDMMTVFVAMDKCTKENACIQVVPGTNRCGRIDHVMYAGQTAACKERVDLLLQQPEYPRVYVEMEPGDALFFHSNVLHCSDRNESGNRRWAFLIAYNAKSNNPVIEHHHPHYTPLNKVKNEAIKTCTAPIDFSQKDIMDLKKDQTIKAKTTTTDQ